jgi:hypothetical protein
MSSASWWRRPAPRRPASPAANAGTWVDVVPGVEPVSPEGEALVHDLRDVEAPFEVLVGGAAARLVDTTDAITARLPVAGLITGGATFVLLFLMFGSLLVPAKALVRNILSLSATFGAMVWVFQDGHGAGLLDFTATGTLDTTVPILMFCIAFGCRWTTRCSCWPASRRSTTAPATPCTRWPWASSTPTASSPPPPPCWPSPPGLRHLGRELRQALRPGPGPGRGDGRHRGAGDPRPGVHAPGRRGQLVAPAPLRRLHQRFGLHEVPDDDEPPAPVVEREPVG